MTVIPIVKEASREPGAGGETPAGRDDAVTVISLFEATRKIHPRAVTGLFAKWRWVLVIATQLVFYGVPWLQWNDRQAVLFDLGARKFHLFGLVLWPQDFIYLTGLLVMSALALFLFTAVAGRLWCGYACPQTVYTELFMWVERLVEGDRNKRIKLDEAPWSARKLRIKATKQALWIAMALWTGFTFVGYFVPIREFAVEIVTGVVGGWSLFWMGFYAFATWGNAGYMREQVCKYMCPYARFQSAMFDKDTLVITYDETRGEPRGSRSRKVDPAAQGLGSCVDCGLCVQVCPTGIDIRQGLQYECIGCAACIDVCDEVMDKMGYPKGLICYTTEHAMDATNAARSSAGCATGACATAVPMPSAWQMVFRNLVRPRTLIYASILFSVFVGVAAGLATRNPLKVDVIRDRAALAREVEGGRIENVYRLQLMNADEAPHRYRITVSGLPGIAIASEPHVEVGAAQNRSVAVRVQVPAGAAEPGSVPVTFEVRAEEEGAHAVRERTAFIVPR